MSIANIADMLAVHARMRPAAPALVHGDTVITYGELCGEVHRRAAALQDAGVGPGAIVGIALKDTIEHVLALYAIARAGAVILPLDCRWRDMEKQRVAEHFKPAVVIVEPGATVAGVPCIEVGDAWLRAVAAAPADRSFPDGNRGVVMSLSSGTTGRPKGPMLTHTQFQARFWTHWIDLGFGSREIYINATPLYFGGGRGFSMSTLYAGGKVVLFPPPYDPAALAAEIARVQGTVLFLVPTLLRRVMDADPAQLLPMQQLSTLISSGSALTTEERKRIKEHLCANFLEYYSSTEGGGVTVLPPSDQTAHGHTVGRPVFAVEVEIVDDSHCPVQIGVAGHIRYRGPAVASGFYNDADAGKDAFHEGWFYPGDLGALDADGYLTLKGRAKDMIIRGGVNIYPQEVEATLLSHPAVSEAAVVGWPSREFNEEVAAFIMLNPGHAVDSSTLIALCRTALASYKVPRDVFFVEALPQNSGGKVIKSELVSTLKPM